MSIDYKENLAKEKLVDVIFSYAGACHLVKIVKGVYGG